MSLFLKYSQEFEDKKLYKIADLYTEAAKKDPSKSGYERNAELLSLFFIQKGEYDFASYLAKKACQNLNYNFRYANNSKKTNLLFKISQLNHANKNNLVTAQAHLIKTNPALVSQSLSSLGLLDSNIEQIIEYIHNPKIGRSPDLDRLRSIFPKDISKAQSRMDLLRNNLKNLIKTEQIAQSKIFSPETYKSIIRQNNFRLLSDEQKLKFFEKIYQQNPDTAREIARELIKTRQMSEGIASRLINEGKMSQGFFNDIVQSIKPRAGLVDDAAKAVTKTTGLADDAAKGALKATDVINNATKFTREELRVLNHWGSKGYLKDFEGIKHILKKNPGQERIVLDILKKAKNVDPALVDQAITYQRNLISAGETAAKATGVAGETAGTAKNVAKAEGIMAQAIKNPTFRKIVGLFQKAAPAMKYLPAVGVAMELSVKFLNGEELDGFDFAKMVAGMMLLPQIAGPLAAIPVIGPLLPGLAGFVAFGGADAARFLGNPEKGMDLMGANVFIKDENYDKQLDKAIQNALAKLNLENKMTKTASSFTNTNQKVIFLSMLLQKIAIQETLNKAIKTACDVETLRIFRSAQTGGSPTQFSQILEANSKIDNSSLAQMASTIKFNTDTVMNYVNGRGYKPSLGDQQALDDWVRQMTQGATRYKNESYTTFSGFGVGEARKNEVQTLIKAMADVAAIKAKFKSTLQ